MKIGNVTFKNNVFLAPMAGITDLPFRIMCQRFGAGATYSEMVSSRALYFDDKKTMTLLKTSPEEENLCVQIFGNSPDVMAQSVDKALCTGAKLIDINMGCPAPKVANNGDGSALLKNPALIGEIVKAVVKESPVPVSCKIRSGFDEVADVEEIAKIIEGSGASAITVHPRTRKMYYSGNADWSIIARVKKAVSIPVIGNGDIFCAQNAKKMLESTGCDGVMVARGARGNPFIFEQILSLLSGKEVKPVSICDKMAVMKEHIKLLVEQKGEFIGVREARKHVAWYTKNLKDSASVRNRVCKIETYDELCEELDRYAEFLQKENL